MVAVFIARVIEVISICKAVGRSLCEADLLPTARDILAKAKNSGRDIVLPVDAVVAQKLVAHVPSRVVSVDEIRSVLSHFDRGHSPLLYRMRNADRHPRFGHRSSFRISYC